MHKRNPQLTHAEEKMERGYKSHQRGTQRRRIALAGWRGGAATTEVVNQTRRSSGSTAVQLQLHQEKMTTIDKMTGDGEWSDNLGLRQRRGLHLVTV